MANRPTPPATTHPGIPWPHDVRCGQRVAQRPTAGSQKVRAGPTTRRLPRRSIARPTPVTTLRLRRVRQLAASSLAHRRSAQSSGPGWSACFGHLQAGSRDQGNRSADQSQPISGVRNATQVRQTTRPRDPHEPST